MSVPCNHQYDQIEHDRQEGSAGVSTRTVLQCIKCLSCRTIEEFTRHSDPSAKPRTGYLVYQRSQTVTRIAVEVQADSEADAIRRANELAKDLDLGAEAQSSFHTIVETDVEKVEEP